MNSDFTQVVRIVIVSILVGVIVLLLGGVNIYRNEVKKLEQEKLETAAKVLGMTETIKTLNSEKSAASELYRKGLEEQKLQSQKQFDTILQQKDKNLMLLTQQKNDLRVILEKKVAALGSAATPEEKAALQVSIQDLSNQILDKDRQKEAYACLTMEVPQDVLEAVNAAIGPVTTPRKETTGR